MGKRVVCIGLLAFFASAGYCAEPIVADVVYVSEPVMSASAEATPSKLPRSRAVPATLKLGFSSEGTSGPETPGLTRIEIDISRNVSLQTRGLPSCTEARLFSHYPRYGESCLGSLVGIGTVTSEVSLRRGEAAVTASGRLRAFYAEEAGRRLILAQVTSAHPPLTYVIPFTLRSAKGPFRTSLLIPKRRMGHLQGICQQGHPECFGTPYTLEGVYSHISSFEMSLHRLFTTHGERGSFVRARCPAPGRRQADRFPLAKVSLDYAGGAALSDVSPRKCRVLE
jgi:hypothetical protein